MKRNKVLVGAIALVLLSGLAVTSSTFAWFTTIRTASITYGDAAVYSRDGNLKIAHVSTMNTLTVNLDEAANKLTYSGGNTVTDISGDGLKFYKPTWSIPVSEAASVTDVSATADGYFVDFTVRLSRDNAKAEPGFKVYLGSGTTIAGKDNADSTIKALNDNTVPATRLAVISNNTVQIRWAPVAESTPSYIVADAAGTYKTVSGYKEQSDSTLISGPILDYDSVSDADTAGVLVANLGTGVATSVDVTFRTWIEGEDEECINDIIGGIYNLEIDLYTLLA
jgi:hypothetical protein